MASAPISSIGALALAMRGDKLSSLLLNPHVWRVVLTLWQPVRYA